MPADRFQGCGRGLLGLANWGPLRKPGEPFIPSSNITTDTDNYVKKSQPWAQTNKNKTQTVSPGRSSEYNNSRTGGDWDREDSRSGRQRSSQHVEPSKTEAYSSNQSSPGNSQEQRSTASTVCTDQNTEQSMTGGPKPGNQLMAKYSYKANVNSPLGEELPMAQGDKLMFVGFHDCHWWLAQNQQGQQGFVPAQYMMVLEGKPTSLPWLKGRQAEEEPAPVSKSKFGVPTAGVWKPYASAYQHKELEKKYYCDVCEKSFNGPQPYSAHMKSRGHREEVENKELYGS